MHVLPFLVAAVIVVVTPGVDMALVTKNALRHGRRAALGTAFGVNVGIALWTLAAAFDVVKFAGAAYLVYLGSQALRRRERAAFFTSLLPQFGHSLPELLLPGALFNAIGIAWLTAYALAASRGRAALQRPRVRAALDTISGVVLVGLGVRLALVRR